MAKQRTEKVYMQTVVVEGSGIFPFDMLRYDNCVPATERDSATMGDGDPMEGIGGISSRRRVTLKRFSFTTNHPATEGRWRSFGWMVVSCNPVT